MLCVFQFHFLKYVTKNVELCYDPTVKGNIKKCLVVNISVSLAVLDVVIAQEYDTIWGSVRFPND